MYDTFISTQKGERFSNIKRNILDPEVSLFSIRIKERRKNTLLYNSATTILGAFTTENETISAGSFYVAPFAALPTSNAVTSAVSAQWLLHCYYEKVTIYAFSRVPVLLLISPYAPCTSTV